MGSRFPGPAPGRSGVVRGPPRRGAFVRHRGASRLGRAGRAVGEGSRGRRRDHRVCDRHARLRPRPNRAGRHNVPADVDHPWPPARPARAAAQDDRLRYRRLRGRAAGVRRRSWPPNSTPRSHLGSGGGKTATVVEDECDAYIHTSGHHQWDSPRPTASCASAAHASHLDGSGIAYNVDEIELPDLLVHTPRWPTASSTPWRSTSSIRAGQESRPR